MRCRDGRWNTRRVDVQMNSSGRREVYMVRRRMSRSGGGGVKSGMVKGVGDAWGTMIFWMCEVTLVRLFGGSQR
jgi:hypothetical protein